VKARKNKELRKCVALAQLIGTPVALTFYAVAELDSMTFRGWDRREEVWATAHAGMDVAQVRPIVANLGDSISRLLSPDRERTSRCSFADKHLGP
jgi:hypothetical protein